MRTLMVCLFVCFFAVPPSALAGRVSLQWEAPEPNVSYFIRYGTQSGNLSSRFEVGTGTTATIPNLTDGRRYYFVVYAYDATRTSPASNRVSVVVQPDPPPPAPAPAPAPSNPAPPPSSESPSTGTTTPPSSVVDSQGAVWTIGPGDEVLRNGVDTGGEGLDILFYQGTIYLFGTDGNWYQWNDGWWQFLGPVHPAGGAVSLAGATRIPPATQIVDDTAGVWTIGANGMILLNGSWASGGLGSEILLTGGTIYVLGTNGVWWQWMGGYWTYFGPNEPD
jgi:hypothetical protein